MSSHHVRRLAKQWVGSIGVPFYDTINMDQAPADPVWVTVELDAFAAETEDYCQHVREEGEIRLVFFGTPGIGDDGLVQAAETAARAFFANSDPAGLLTMWAWGPPNDYGDAPYAVEIPVSYEYTYTP